MFKRLDSRARKVLVASAVVLPVAALIAVLSTGVMSRQMFGRGAMLGDAGRWIAWALRANLQSADPPSANDDAFVRFDGTGGVNCQTSGVICDDSNNVTGVNNLTVNGALVANENGGNNDCRIEGDTDANLISTDASADRVGVGVDLGFENPICKLHVQKSHQASIPTIATSNCVLMAQNSSSDDSGCDLNLIGGDDGVTKVVFGSPSDLTIGQWSADGSTGECAFTTDVLKMDCGYKMKNTAVTTTYTVLATDYFLSCTTSGSNYTVTLPSASSSGVGKVLIIKANNAGNTVTIQRAGGDTIEGANTKTISSYQSYTLTSDGSSTWLILGST